MITRAEELTNFVNLSCVDDFKLRFTSTKQVHVIVSPGNGRQVEGKHKAWTDGIENWYNFVINDEEQSFKQVGFDLAKHIEGLGLTGWDWRHQATCWVGFDFDSITNHKQGLRDFEIKEIIDNLSRIPWVELRYSKSGKGIHVYVHFRPYIPTKDRNEHGAVARAVLHKLAALTGFDFKDKVDALGSNLWIWHKNTASCGFKQIKQSIPLEELIDWKAHICVVSKKTIHADVGNEDIEELTTKKNIISLDNEHKKVIHYLQDNSYYWTFDKDKNMLTTHSKALEQAHKDLELRGIFKTIATGKEHMDKNCFCFSGNTKFISQNGIFTLKEKVGQKVKVWGITKSGKQDWLDGEVLNFGSQKTYPILFGTNELVRATKQHNWMYWTETGTPFKKRKQTSELKRGMRLPQAIQKLPSFDKKGYAHGFVFGDGSRYHSHDCVRNEYCEVILFGSDKDMSNILSNFGVESLKRTSNKEILPIFRQLPKEWKELPTSPSREYALGFILGLITADGHIRRDGIRIMQSNPILLEQIRELAIYAGLKTFPIYINSRKESNKFENSLDGWCFQINTYNLDPSYFVRQDHKKAFHKSLKQQTISVKNIDWNDEREEEVFCVYVPEHHNFTLANGVITGNCFPLKNGGWVIRRFGKGVKEDSAWEIDSGGWTRCYFNVELDLSTAARCFGGLAHPSGAQFFKTADAITMTGQALGLYIDLPTMANYCEGKMRENKDGKLVVEISDKDHKLATDPKMVGWIKEGNIWKKIFNKQKTIRVDEEFFVHDDLIRHLITPTGDDHGWVINSDGQWNSEGLQHIKLALGSMGIQSKEMNQILGSNIIKFWKLVNIPFAPEYPGNRQWNKNSAKIRFQPSVQIPDSLGQKCPHWFKILSHIGKSLDQILPACEWAASNGIMTGADYLIAWIASLFQEPAMPLPYLFLYGPQCSGKSIFHEALSELIINGVVRADNALTSKGNFNAELEAAVLGVIEETNLGKNPEAANKIKDLVTSREIQIHTKGMTPYTAPNTLHFCQMSNEISACPIFKGDSRIQVFYVEAFKPNQHIPKKQLIEQLVHEAPDFMAYVLNYQIPKSPDRLNVPVIETSEKLIIVDQNKSSLEVFLEEKCYHVPGQWMLFDKFYSEFVSWMGPTTEVWSKIRVGRGIIPPYVKGRDMSTNQLMIANISFDKNAKEDGRYILNGEKIIKVGNREEINGENISQPEEAMSTS